MADAAIELDTFHPRGGFLQKTPCFVPAFSAHNRNVTKDTGLLHSLLYNLDFGAQTLDYVRSTNIFRRNIVETFGPRRRVIVLYILRSPIPRIENNLWNIGIIIGSFYEWLDLIFSLSLFFYRHSLFAIQNKTFQMIEFWIFIILHDLFANWNNWLKKMKI